MCVNANRAHAGYIYIYMISRFVSRARGMHPYSYRDHASDSSGCAVNTSMGGCADSMRVSPSYSKCRCIVASAAKLTPSARRPAAETKAVVAEDAFCALIGYADAGWLATLDPLNPFSSPLPSPDRPLLKSAGDDCDCLECARNPRRLLLGLARRGLARGLFGLARVLFGLAR